MLGDWRVYARVPSTPPRYFDGHHSCAALDGIGIRMASTVMRMSVICSDMDGTVLPSGAFPRRISTANAAALKEAIARGVKVIIATGKRPGPWLPPLRAALGYPDDGGVVLNAPSVMMNGLLVTDTDGTVRHKSTLDVAVIARVVAFGAQHSLTAMAYLDDGRIVWAASMTCGARGRRCSRSRRPRRSGRPRSKRSAAVAQWRRSSRSCGGGRPPRSPRHARTSTSWSAGRAARLHPQEDGSSHPHFIRASLSDEHRRSLVLC